MENCYKNVAIISTRRDWHDNDADGSCPWIAWPQGESTFIRLRLAWLLSVETEARHLTGLQRPKDKCLMLLTKLSEIDKLRYSLNGPHLPLEMYEYIPGESEKEERKEQKRLDRLLVECRKHQNWFRFVFAHHHLEYLKAFRRVSSELNDDEYWELLAQVWIDVELPTATKEDLKMWSHLFGSKRSNREMLMAQWSEFLEAYRQLPEKVTIYRGALSRFRCGLSWTTRKKTAEFFAERSGPSGKLYERTVNKTDVIAYFAAKEFEIIIHPSKVYWKIDDGKEG